ncbi:MAG: ABC transporter ATP-binding protein, partial [Methanobrevibacter sp.]|nr:ABC transporter ATP-binding protein [Candidatus Methanoflexus mossambicus]
FNKNNFNKNNFNKNNFNKNNFNKNNFNKNNFNKNNDNNDFILIYIVDIMANIILKNISMVYNGDKEDFKAIEDINLKINSGEFVSIIGPSGCGKSTLIEIIAGIKKPSAGEVLINNEVVDKPNSNVGVVFQDYSLFPWMNSYDNLKFAIENTNEKLSDDEINKKTIKHLKMVGLENFKNSYPNALSGGMRQRLAISRMFATDNEIFLMDEPFGALDAINRIKMQDLLLSLLNDGDKKQTTVYVSHDIDEAIFLSDRIVVMNSSKSENKSNPGKIKEIINVPFQKLRNREELFFNKEYISIKNYIFKLLNPIDLEVKE